MIEVPRRRSVATLTLTAALGLAATAAMAQEPARPVDPPVAKKAAAPAKPKPGLTITGEARFRYEDRQNAAFWDAQDKNPKDELGRFRLGFNYQFENGPRVYIEPQFNWQHDLCVAKSTGSDWEADIFNGYVEFGNAHQLWRVGRQELLFGEGRLIAPSNWSNSGRSYDAARWTIADKKTRTDLFVGKVGHVGVKYPHPLFAGIYSTITPKKDLSYDLYLLFKSLDVDPHTLQEMYTVGTRPKARWGQIDAYGEAAYQFGKYGARPISAYAYTGNVGYTFKGALGLRLAAEYDFASGGNPTAGTYTTFDQMFLTNHSVVDSILGMYDAVGWRNMREWRLNALFKPARKWTVSLDGHYFMLDNAIDYWYGKGGSPMPGVDGKGIRDATGASGRDLGSEADVSVSYEVCKGLVVGGQFAYFMPGSFVRNANGGHADNANWFMFQTEYKW